MVFTWIPPPQSPSNLTTTPPNNLTEVLNATESLPETTLATLATASPLKSTSPETTTMPEKFIPKFLTREFCDYLANDLHRVTEEFAESGGFSLVYKITNQYIGIPITQLVVKATNFCQIPLVPQTPNGTNIEPELDLNDTEIEVAKPCTALQVTLLLFNNLSSKVMGQRETQSGYFRLSPAFMWRLGFC